eukprot:240648-Pyramimonas_sp.AAC.1
MASAAGAEPSRYWAWYQRCTCRSRWARRRFASRGALILARSNSEMLHLLSPLPWLACCGPAAASPARWSSAAS